MTRVLACALIFLLAQGEFFASAGVPTSGGPALAQQQKPPSQPSSAPPTVGPLNVATAGATPLPNTLMDRTPVKLRLSETISSADAKIGQQVPFEVTEDVVVEGVIVIRKGSRALATVTTAAPKKRMGRGGKLNVNVDSARLVDGERVQLTATRESNGGGHVGAMTGAMAATSVVFFPAAPLFLLIKGKNITIPEGTEITAYVQGDMVLDLAKLGTPATGGAAGTSGADSQSANLTVDSSVPGADIEVDGSFMGVTPSTLSIPPGQHTILVKKSGYSDWTRTMNVSGSSVRVSVEMKQSAAAQ